MLQSFRESECMTKYLQATKHGAITAIVMFLVALIAMLVVYYYSAAGLKQEVRGYLESLAKTSAIFTDGDLHQQITKPEDKGTENYEKARAPYMNILKANPNIAFIYTLIEIDSKFYFVLDSQIPPEGEEEDTSAVMEEYTDYTQTLKEAITQQKVLVEEEAYTDDWGTFLSGYAPIYNSAGQYLGIVGVDIRIDDYLARMSTVLYALEAGIILALLASIICGVFAYYVKRDNMIGALKLAQQQEHLIKVQEQNKQAELAAAKLAEEQREAAIKRQEELIAEEIAHIIAACAEGDFTKRLPEEGKVGLLLTLSRGLNQIGDVTLGGLNELKNTITNLSHGDLTCVMNSNHKGIFGEIANSLNATISSLARMVQNIKHAADKVAGTSSNIAHTSKDLSTRTEEQASTLDETTSAMEELLTNVRSNREVAKEANSLTHQSASIANNSEEIAKAAVQSIMQIQESSAKISEIISAIDEIAFQTNLLALNAAVEAARAGDAGKGFAVVATEVRALANRSAEASRQIKELINNSISQISCGVEQVKNSGQALGDIIQSVNKVSELMNKIDRASHDQTEAIEQVTHAIENLDSTTQHNAAMVHDASNDAQSLSLMAQELKELVEKFKLNS